MFFFFVGGGGGAGAVGVSFGHFWSFGGVKVS